MKVVELKVENVLKAHENTNRKGKQLLENLVPSLFIKDIRERIKSYEDACKFLGINAHSSLSAYEKLKIIIRALNQDWVADYSNSNQRKYYPYWVYTAGSGFRLRAVTYDYSTTLVGAPFVFASEELVRYATTQFNDLYNEMLTEI